MAIRGDFLAMNRKQEAKAIALEESRLKGARQDWVNCTGSVYGLL